MAKQGFEALMSGDEHVYAASLGVKIQGALAGLAPEALVANMHERMTQPADK